MKWHAVKNHEVVKTFNTKEEAEGFIMKETNNVPYHKRWSVWEDSFA